MECSKFIQKPLLKTTDILKPRNKKNRLPLCRAICPKMTEIRFRNPRDIHGAHRQMSHQATRNTVGQCFKAAWESRSQGLKVKSPFPPDTSRIELFIFMYVLYLCFMIFHVNLQKLMLLQQGVCLFLPLSYLCCFMPCPTVTKSSSHMLISMVKRTAT